MARFPCELDGERYKGRAVYVYFTSVKASAAEKLRLRVCFHCYDELMELLMDFHPEVANAGDWNDIARGPMCYRCGFNTSVGALFVTAYHGDVFDPRELFARLCDECERVLPAPLPRWPEIDSGGSPDAA